MTEFEKTGIAETLFMHKNNSICVSFQWLLGFFKGTEYIYYCESLDNIQCSCVVKETWDGLRSFFFFFLKTGGAFAQKWGLKLNYVLGPCVIFIFRNIFIYFIRNEKR